MDGEFAFYEENKLKLFDVLNTRGVVIDKKTDGGFVGLLNQGATCYLNSLIQSLFHDIAFRNAIYSADGSSKIVQALQSLFASMQHSDSSAVNTVELSNAFGWTKSQVFEQQDVHELFSVLVEALGQTSPDLNMSLLKLFQGSFRDVLRCPGCSFRKETPATFLNLSLDLPDCLELAGGEDGLAKASTQFVSLKDLLQNYMKPEVLDPDNMWECGGCNNKVQATKTQEFDQLPTRLFLHLKRFRFDPTSRRKRKLSTPILFQQTLDASCLVSSKSPVMYNLKSVMVHTGTALGGHYRSYVTTTGGWLDCNDSSVSALSSDDEKSVFWYQGETIANYAECTQNVLLYESAYLLVFEKADAPTTTPLGAPTELVSRVEVLNEESRVLRRLMEVHKTLVELIIYFNPGIGACALCIDDKAGAEGKDVKVKKADKISLFFPGKITLSQALIAAYEEYVKAGVDDSPKPMELCRLRRYNDANNRLGETFGGREASTLAELGLAPTSGMLLDRRDAADPPFVEFNPREMNLRLSVWNNSEGSQGAGGTSCSVVVPGEDNATVGGLRKEAASALHVSDSQRIVLIHCTDRNVNELNDDSKLLRKEYGLWNGDEIVVDLIPDGAAIEGFDSPALKALRDRKRTISVCYNIPTKEGAEYNQSLETSVDNTLGEVIKLLATALNLSIDGFHVRRNASAPQLKDLSKTLHDLGFVDQSVLHVQLGAGCGLGEHMLRFELDPDVSTDITKNTEGDSGVGGDSELVPLGELIVREKSTVLQLKEQLLANWSTLSTSVAVPATPNHVRIRDGKNAQASGPLRNDRVLSRCLLGLADGRRLVVQILPEEEVIGADDVVLSVRLASYEGRSLSRVIDLPLPRSSTVQSLFTVLLKKFPQLDEVPPEGTVDPTAVNTEEDMENAAPHPEEGAEGTTEDAAAAAAAPPTLPPVESKVMAVAKAFTSGPPLTLKSALKLKWNDPAILRRADSQIDHPPLNLRDGSVIVVRGIADFERARAIAKARREAEGPRPVSAGTGASAVKAKAAAKARLAAAKERPLRIGSDGAASDGSNPPPPGASDMPPVAAN